MKQPKFYVLMKDINTGSLEPYEVLGPLFDEMLTKRGKIKKSFCSFDENLNAKPIGTKEELMTAINGHFMHRYWARCECEFIVCDWPNMDRVEDSRPIKIDMYEQLKPNLPLIVDIVWNFVQNRI